MTIDLTSETGQAEKTVRTSGAKRGPGRPRKLRHDVPAEAPVDGDYSPLMIVNADPAYEYAGIDDVDRPRFMARGYAPVPYTGPNGPRWKWVFGELKHGQEQRSGLNTLMCVRRETIAAIRRAEMGAGLRKHYDNDQVALSSGGVAEHITKKLGD